MGTLFISDLHLHPSRPAILDGFRQFLQRQAADAEALYILGDLFDVWIGDDYAEPAFAAVLQDLRACTEAGTPVFLMHGNRDFLIGEQFAAATGCTLLTDPTRIDLYGTPTLLMHGDTLCTDDGDYQALRKKVRNPAWQEQALSLPVPERLELAAQARELSSLATGQKDETIMDVNQDEVQRVMREYHVRLLIHGHTHRPGNHEVDLGSSTARRIVLGDWYSRGEVLVINRNGLERLQIHAA